MRETSSSHGGECEAQNLLGRTSETSVDIQLGTRQYIPEDSELNIQCYHLHTKFHHNPKIGSKFVPNSEV
jgi:hypothetical protein